MFVALTDTETNSTKPIRQALMKKIKDNFDDIQARLLAVESSLRMFDHFTWDDSNVDAAPGTPNLNLWRFGVQTGGPPDSSAALRTTEHSVRLTATPGASKGAIRMRGVLRLTPPQSPVAVFRFKTIASWADFSDLVVGMGNDRDAGHTDLTPTDGVFLQMSGTSLRFASIKNGAQTSSSTFTRPAADTWMEVEVKYIDSNSVECRFDGDLKETFDGPTDNVPDGFGDIMFPEVQFAVIVGGGTEEMDVDRGDAKLQSIADL